jgi:curved DNA-binding protein CbpA
VNKKINIFESSKVVQFDVYTKEAYELLINKIFQKKYDWFVKIIVDDLMVSMTHVRPHLGMRAKIYVDSDWGGKQWREYNYSESMPEEDEELTFGDIIGGNLSREIQKDITHLFQMITGIKVLTLSFSWVDAYLVKKSEEGLQESIIKILKEEFQSNFVRRRYNLLGDYIRSSYRWLDPKRFGNFGEFLERVIFSTTRDFTTDQHQGDYESLQKIRDKVYPDIKGIILSEYREELYEYFIDNFLG